MILRVCDLCKKNPLDIKIKYKYRGKKRWVSFHEFGWERIGLCQECLDKIIEADKEKV